MMPAAVYTIWHRHCRGGILPPDALRIKSVGQREVCWLRTSSVLSDAAVGDAALGVPASDMIQYSETYSYAQRDAESGVPYNVQTGISGL